ncbi:MAG TPA: dihydrofolate reductase family protein, partial [Nitriliruptorales bacterium]|nr:dihydrofolate reductase family protein [Nitriliruptorales bacterium]
DAILIGASTVRIEDYGPPRPVEAARARRAARGLAPVPGMVVVTATAQLQPAARLFTDPSWRPMVLVPQDADPTRLEALRLVSDVVTVGRGRVELPAALRQLRRSGVRWLLCEGGPTLNAELLSDGLVDELFLTVAPQLVGATRRRIVHGELRGGPWVLELVELREHASELLLRYRLVRAGRSHLR